MRVQIGSSGAETSYGVSATPDGDVVITASTEGTLAGDHQGKRDVFLARYSKQGDQLWALQTGGEANDSPLGVSVAPDGSIYVGGFTDGDFAGPNQGSADVWLARFDGDGNELWRTQFGSDQWDRGFDVSAFNGGAYISGYSASTLDPGTYQGGFDGFAARFDADGNQQWVRQFGTDSTDWGQGSALAPDGGLYVTGYTEGDFGGPNSGDKDLFVVRLSAQGEMLWVTQLGSDALDWTQGVAIGPEGGVLVAGSTEGSFADLVGDERDMIVVSLSSEGEERWRWQSAIPGADTAFEVRMVGNRVLATGSVYNSDPPADLEVPAGILRCNLRSQRSGLCAGVAHGERRSDLHQVVRFRSDRGGDRALMSTMTDRSIGAATRLGRMPTTILGRQTSCSSAWWWNSDGCHER